MRDCKVCKKKCARPLEMRIGRAICKKCEARDTMRRMLIKRAKFPKVTPAPLDDIPNLDIGPELGVNDSELDTDTTIIPADAFADLRVIPDKWKYTPSRPLERVAFIPDCHLPFHHPANFQLMVRALRIFMPDVIVVLGDLHDFYAVNAHGKRPDRNGLLLKEVEMSRPFLRQIEDINPDAKLIYIEGNHEYRFERYIESQASSLFGITDVRRILALDKWVWVPYKKSYRLGRVHLTHDTGTAGRNAARTSMDAFQGSAVIGHTHRMEMSFMGNADGPAAVGAMFGWLGDPVHADYMHEVQARRNWVQGFGIGWMRSSGVVHMMPCPIVDGAVVIDGRIIT